MRPEYLFLLCIGYTIAACNEYWLVNWLGSLYNIKLAILFALFQNSTWPIQILYYIYLRRRDSSSRMVTKEMLRNYTILGCLSSFITLTRTIGLTTLPPTLYVICANTEIVFETIMTKMILKKDVNQFQLLAVLLVIAGVSISLYNPRTHRYGHNENVSQSELIAGVILSIASRFASSLNTISAEKFLGKDRKSYYGVLEVSIANSLIPSFILPLALLVAPEYHQWKSLSSFHGIDQFVIAMLCIGIALSKYADRLCKFSIVHAASTLFYAVVDANMKVVAGIGSFIFFNEKIFWPQILGFVMIVGSMAVSILNKYLVNKEALANAMVSFELTDELEMHMMATAGASNLFVHHHPQSSEKMKASFAQSRWDKSAEYSLVKGEVTTNIILNEVTSECDFNEDDGDDLFGLDHIESVFD